MISKDLRRTICGAVLCMNFVLKCDRSEIDERPGRIGSQPDPMIPDETGYLAEGNLGPLFKCIFV